MPFSQERIKRILKQRIPTLTIDDINDFLEISTYSIKDDKKIIIKSGTKPQLAFYILEGAVRGYIYNDQGIEKNILLRSDGYIVGDPNKLFFDEEQRFTYESIEKIHYLLFNINDFETLVRKNPNINDWYISILKEVVVILNYRVETMVSMTAKDRYIDLIRKNPTFLDKAYGKYIANFLGITPVSFSRILNEIKNENNPI